MYGIHGRHIILQCRAMRTHDQRQKVLYMIRKPLTLQTIKQMRIFKKLTSIPRTYHNDHRRKIQFQQNRLIKHSPISKTRKWIITYLGYLGYYRRNIQNFAKICQLLTKRLK